MLLGVSITTWITVSPAGFHSRREWERRSYLKGERSKKKKKEDSGFLRGPRKTEHHFPPRFSIETVSHFFLLCFK